MKLDKNTPRRLFEIRVPIWDGRKVGLAAHKLQRHNEVQILYKDTDGQREHPGAFYISGEKARTYPSKPVKNYPNVILHWIPIADLEILEVE